MIKIQHTLKRLLDILGAATALLLFSPLLAWLYIKVKRKLGAPVFFSQTRIGQNERPFTLIKFRTMRSGSGTDAERMHPFGQWLRATSLDELPELWNILKGDMSMVGPRPLLPEYIPYYSPREATRHSMRPGITGLAQVSGRNALTWDARLELDAQYVEDWHIGKDIRIVLKTIRTVLKKEGITAEGHATMYALHEERKGALDGTH